MVRLVPGQASPPRRVVEIHAWETGSRLALAGRVEQVDKGAWVLVGPEVREGTRWPS